MMAKPSEPTDPLLLEELAIRLADGVMVRDLRTMLAARGLGVRAAKRAISEAKARQQQQGPQPKPVDRRMLIHEVAKRLMTFPAPKASALVRQLMDERGLTRSDATRAVSQARDVVNNALRSTAVGAARDIPGKLMAMAHAAHNRGDDETARRCFMDVAKLAERLDEQQYIPGAKFIFATDLIKELEYKDIDPEALDDLHKWVTAGVRWWGSRDPALVKEYREMTEVARALQDDVTTFAVLEE